MHTRPCVLALVALSLFLVVGCGNLFDGIDLGASDSEGSPSGSGGYEPETICTPGIVGLACTGVAQGFSCAQGVRPEDQDPNLSCSTAPADAGAEGDYCCVLTIPGSSCTPTALTCPDYESFGYRCLPGDNPEASETSLACDEPTSDGDGVHEDYCCEYDLGIGIGSTGSGSGGSSSSSGPAGSSSGGPAGSGSGSSSGGAGGSSGAFSGSTSGGPLPAGCTTAPTIRCTAGATGYACVTGANPETEDPSRACSAAQVLPGEDEYCCYDGFFGDASTCLPDDTLTAACPGQNTYGYQCLAGSAPTAVDASLICGASPTPDADGAHEDYCCTRP